MAESFWEKLKDDAKAFGEGVKEGFEKESLKQEEALANFHDLFAWADGALIALPTVDKAGEKSLLRLHVKTQKICAPCSGIFEGMDTKSHTLLLESDGGMKLGLQMEGENPCQGEEHLLVRPGEKIVQGQPLIEFEKPVEMDSRLYQICDPSASDPNKTASASNQ